MARWLRYQMALSRQMVRGMSDAWRPMETAPKDGTRVLVRFKDDLRAFDTSDEFRLERWQGLEFVARHHGYTTRTGYDMGWGFAAPVGQGGFPDAWLVGWVPLPPAPSGQGEQS